MNIRKPHALATLLLGALATTSLIQAQTLIYDEEFDGTGNGYNVDSTTALAGDDDWVDFDNRVTTDFSGNEGYFTAVGGSEGVLAGRSNSGDLQIRTDFSPGIDKTQAGRIEIRVRIDLNQNDIYDDDLTAANLSLFWGTSTYVSPGAQNGNPQVSINTIGSADQVIAQADGWHLFIWRDDGGITGGSGNTVNSWRLDAVNGNSGASFEVDYFKIEETQLSVLDPEDPIPAEYTLRESWEWNTDGDLEGWTANPNGQYDITGVAGGLFTGVSNAGDPGTSSPDFEVLDVETSRFIIEIGIVSDVGDTSSKQLFWGIDGNGVTGQQSVPLPTVPNDGSPHVIRVTLDDLINGRLTKLRYDPSTTGSITTNLDYIRVYSEGPEIPFFPPPIAELDPEDALGPEFILQRTWTWATEDDLEGWAGNGLEIMNPNDGITGVFDGSIFTNSLINDSWLLSPSFSINTPASEQYVVEIDYPADFGPEGPGQFFWTDNGGGPAPSRSASTPEIPSDNSPHTVRITMTNNVNGALQGLRIDSTNLSGTYYGIDEVRIYTNGVPVSTKAPQITSLTYDSTTGAAEAELSGDPTTVYSFVSAADLNFGTASPITLTGATVGMLSGGGVETDNSGNATVQFNLGTDPTNFVRAED
jgi:hypothetical protein